MKSASRSAAPVPSSIHALLKTSLSARSLALLKRLNEEQAFLLPHPFEDDHLIIRVQRAGISLASGLFSRILGTELERHDLIRRCSDIARPSWRISESGQAFLLRHTAQIGDAFLMQHRSLTTAVMDISGTRETVTVNMQESPLAWLHRRKGKDGKPLVDEACFEAGERLRRDLTFAGSLPSISASWNMAYAPSGQSRCPADATDSMIAARQRVHQALRAAGADMADLLIDLCGFLKGLEQIERERRWPARSAKVVVIMALTRLAAHYGLSHEAQGKGRC
jgi:hypothetical protein